MKGPSVRKVRALMSPWKQWKAPARSIAIEKTETHLVSYTREDIRRVLGKEHQLRLQGFRETTLEMIRPGCYRKKFVVDAYTQERRCTLTWHVVQPQEKDYL